MNINYSKSFKDSIQPQIFNEKAKEILKWTKINRKRYDWAKVPNVYELVNLFLFASKYKKEDKDIDLDILKEIWDLRKVDLEKTGINKSNFVYMICEDSYNSLINGKPLVNDEKAHYILRELADIGLNFEQQKNRNEKSYYNNTEKIKELSKSSKLLLSFYPELYKKYNVEENIKMINNT